MISVFEKLERAWKERNPGIECLRWACKYVSSEEGKMAILVKLAFDCEVKEPKKITDKDAIYRFCYLTEYSIEGEGNYLVAVVNKKFLKS